MDGILGQDRTVGILETALKAGRVHHAYIFHGPMGVGKFTTACAWAKMYLCHDRQTDLAGNLEACGGCPSCRFWKGHESPDGAMEIAHPDFRVIRKELAAVSDNAALRKRKQLNIPVDLLRQHMLGGTTSDSKEHSAAVYQTARLGHGKVFIIDEAELLDRHGQNALLKTLEEPPPGTCIILISAREDQLLMTIRSRCQRVAFSRLPDDVLDRWLNEHLGVDSPPQRAELLAVADGSPGRAKLAVKYQLAPWAVTVERGLTQMTRGDCPVEMGGQLAQLIDSFAAAWVENHPNGSKEAANQQAAQWVLSLIGSHARRRMHDHAGHVPAGDWETGESTLEPWARVTEIADQTWREIDANVNVALACDHLVSMLWAALAPPASRPPGPARFAASHRQ